MESLIEALKTPETLEETIEYLKKDPVCQTTIEDLAFKQVVLNILIAAGIVTENDFNASVSHFKEVLTESFAENILKRVQELKKIKLQVQEPEEETTEEIEIDDNKDIAKA